MGRKIFRFKPKSLSVVNLYPYSMFNDFNIRKVSDGGY